jgi:predicted porin
LWAGFWLEAQIDPDSGIGGVTNTNNQASGGGASGTCSVTGATPAVAGVPVTCAATVSPNGSQGLNFNRRSTVSLGGSWGELRLGRDYTPQFWNLNLFNPFGTLGVGTDLAFQIIITGPTSVRASNSVGYFLPANLGGFYGQVQYYAGENASTAANSDDGTGVGLRLGYRSGPFDVAVASSRTDARNAATVRAGATGSDIRQENIAASWDFKVAKISGMISSDRVGSVDARGALIGLRVPVGPGEIKAAVQQYKIDRNVGGPELESRKWAVGYIYNLSKRTALYTAYARVNNKGGAAAPVVSGVGAPGPNASSSGFDLGIRHTF